MIARRAVRLRREVDSLLQLTQRLPPQFILFVSPLKDFQIHALSQQSVVQGILFACNLRAQNISGFILLPCVNRGGGRAPKMSFQQTWHTLLSESHGLSVALGRQAFSWQLLKEPHEEPSFPRAVCRSSLALFPIL